MNFSLFFSKKIAVSKDNKNNLSRVIVFIGRLSVALGIVISLITVGMGVGAKKSIKNKTGDFNGHISIKSTRSNSSYNSSVLEKEDLDLSQIKAISEVDDLQSYATVSGILRTKDHFSGVILKGVAKDFNAQRFEKFMVEGRVPHYEEKAYNNQVILSQKIANDLQLKPKDSIVAIFSTAEQKPIYRKFEISGIYKTDINLIDDLFIIGDINHVRRIQGMEKTDIGGVDVFLKDSDDINQVFPLIERHIGYKNYAEKMTDKYPKILDFINIFDTNISIVVGIMLIVVVINIIMVLLILIIERTNSIGVLKTLGASNRQIRSIFINYTLMIMLPGLFVGNAIGIGVLLLQKYFGIIRLNPEDYFMSVVPVDLNPFYILAISAGVFLVSAISLILPSYLIGNISPIKSIKYN